MSSMEGICLELDRVDSKPHDKKASFSGVAVVDVVTDAMAASSVVLSNRRSSSSGSSSRNSSTLPRQPIMKRSATKRQKVARARSFLMLLGYAALLFGLTYRNLQSLMVHREAAHLTPSSGVAVGRDPDPLAAAQRRTERHLRSFEGVSKGLRYLSFGTVSNASYLLQPPTLFHQQSSVRHVLDSFTDLAAACTQSLFGNNHEDIFDVVTIEYDTWTPSHALLASRIRTRFPLSTMVYIERIHLDSQLMLFPTNVTFGEWKRELSSLEGEQEMAQAMAEAALEIEDGRWNLLSRRNKDPRTGDPSDPLLILYRPEPTTNLRSQREIADYLSLFDLNTHRNTTSFSLHGHNRMASDIERLVETKQVLVDSTKGLGGWGSGDDCHIWFSSGDYSIPHNGRPIVLENAAGNHHHHHHAIEFRRRGNTAPMIITIFNPFPTERLLSLTYLTDADSMAYAKTRISVNGRPQSVIQPYHDDNDSSLRLPRTTGVGFVPPGKSVVRLEPLVDLPFHLLGASLFANESQGLTSLEFASVAQVDDAALRVTE